MRAKLNGTTLGAVALAAAGVVFGAAVTSATVGAPLGPSAGAAEPEPTQATAEPVARAQPAGGTVAREVIQLAAERAPFESDRRPPPERYLLPYERVVDEPPRAEPEREPPPMPPFRVLGTVGGPDGGVVVIAAEGDQPRVYATGDRLLGYQVKSVQGDAVVVSSEGWDMTLAVESGESSGGGRGDDDRRRNSRDQEREQERTERAMEQARERVNQIMQQMREQGGPVRIEMQGDRAVIVGPNGVRREVELPGNSDRNVIIRQAAPAVRVRPGGPGGGGN